MKEKLDHIRQAGKMRQLQDEMNEQFLETPTFGQYFNKKAKGQDLYGKLGGYDHERAEEQEEFDRIMEEQDDEESYRRELLARMFGNKLTARQFGVLMRMGHDEREQAKLDKEYEL